MGRNQFEEHQPSCSMWMILNYHHWQRKLKTKKNRTRKYAMCWKNPRTISFNHDNDETQQLWGAETGYSEVEQHISKSNPTNKSSAKERMKEIIAKEISKNATLGSSAQLSDRDQTNWKHPIIILRRNSATKFEAPFSTGEVSASSYARSNSSAKECGDVFEIYGVNKDLVVKVLKDPNSGFSSTKAKLKKSGSFPVRNIGPSTLQHKKNESWSFRKVEKFPTLSQSEKIDASESRKDPETRLSSQGWNRSVIKYIKKIIKQALNEKKHNTSKDELLQVSRGEKEISEEQLKTEDDVAKRVRRTQSLTESLDRYSQLFEKSFNKETTKLDHCKSLRLAGEDKISSKRASQFCRTISSYSDLESICSLLTEVSRDTFSSEMPISSTLDDYNVSTGRNSCSEQKIDSIPEETTDKSEAVIMNDEQKLTVEKRNSVDENVVDEISPQIEKEDLSHETLNPIFVSDNIEGCFEKTEDSNFSFVSDILELSGFIENEFPEAWHSIEQPLNPSLFKETFFHTDENGDVHCHEQLLFDLTNEALMNIYNRSYTYFPKAFSITPCTRALPNGTRVVEEVWSMVSWFLDFKPRTDQSLDDIIGQDMARGDGWMKLHTEADCIALDLEELIFNELLDEVI